MPLIESYRYSRANIRSHPDWLFAFGDNLEESGYGGQAREARGEPNAVGIVTKRAPSMAEAAFLEDTDLPSISFRWRMAFTRLNAHLMAGGTVIWPSDGIGTGRAQLATRAPALWRELQIYIAGMRAVSDAAPYLRPAKRDEPGKA